MTQASAGFTNKGSHRSRSAADKKFRHRVLRPIPNSSLESVKLVGNRQRRAVMPRFSNLRLRIDSSVTRRHADLAVWNSSGIKKRVPLGVSAASNQSYG